MWPWFLKCQFGETCSDRDLPVMFKKNQKDWSSVAVFNQKLFSPETHFLSWVVLPLSLIQITVIYIDFFTTQVSSTFSLLFQVMPFFSHLTTHQFPAWALARSARTTSCASSARVCCSSCCSRSRLGSSGSSLSDSWDMARWKNPASPGTQCVSSFLKFDASFF